MGWHLLGADMRLPDGREVRVGETLTVEGPPSIVEGRGLRACPVLMDALHYFRGTIVCRVRLGGEIDVLRNLASGTERTLLWVARDDVLSYFAIWCTRRALRRGNVTDPLYWRVLREKRRWLRHLATDADVRSAQRELLDVYDGALAHCVVSAANTRAVSQGAWAAAVLNDEDPSFIGDHLEKMVRRSRVRL